MAYYNQTYQERAKSLIESFKTRSSCLFNVKVNINKIPSKEYQMYWINVGREIDKYFDQKEQEQAQAIFEAFDAWSYGKVFELLTKAVNESWNIEYINKLKDLVDTKLSESALYNPAIKIK